MPIVCEQCGAPITSRDTLAVVGRTLRPLHTACRPAYAARQPWYASPGLALNRWQSFAIFNALLLGGALLFHLAIAPLDAAQWRMVLLLMLAASTWLLIARAVCWFSIERRIHDAPHTHDASIRPL